MSDSSDNAAKTRFHLAEIVHRSINYSYHIL